MHPKIKTMIDGMARKEKRKNGKRTSEKWSLYMLRCGDGSIYTGIAKDVQKRYEAHDAGKGARYTRTRRPVRLVYTEKCGSRSQALVRECKIKALPKAKKEQMCT